MDIKTTENMKEKASKYLEAFVLYSGKPDPGAVVERADRHTALLEACMEDNHILYCIGELHEIKHKISNITDSMDKTIGLPEDGDFDPGRFAAKLATKIAEEVLELNRTCWVKVYHDNLAHAIHDLVNLRLDYIKRFTELQNWPYVFNSYAELFKRADVNRHMLGDFATKYLAYAAARISSADDIGKAAHRLYRYWEVLLAVYKAMYLGHITPGAKSNAEWLCGCAHRDSLTPIGNCIAVAGNDFYCPFDAARALMYAGDVDIEYSDVPDIVKDILTKIKKGE